VTAVFLSIFMGMREVGTQASVCHESHPCPDRPWANAGKRGWAGAEGEIIGVSTKYPAGVET
jgi:hypothetical protein